MLEFAKQRDTVAMSPNVQLMSKNLIRYHLLTYGLAVTDLLSLKSSIQMEKYLLFNTGRGIVVLVIDAGTGLVNVLYESFDNLPYV